MRGESYGSEEVEDLERDQGRVAHKGRASAHSRRGDGEIRENELRELREIAGKTQVDVASAAGFDQGELSRIERREDHMLSTLRRYVEALGGELEVVVVIGDHRVRLRSV